MFTSRKAITTGLCVVTIFCTLNTQALGVKWTEILEEIFSQPTEEKRMQFLKENELDQVPLGLAIAISEDVKTLRDLTKTLGKISGVKDLGEKLKEANLGGIKIGKQEISEIFSEENPNTSLLVIVKKYEIEGEFLPELIRALGKVITTLQPSIHTSVEKAKKLLLKPWGWNKKP